MVNDFPPQWTDSNKALAYSIASATNAKLAGELTYTRWQAQPLPAAVPERQPQVTARPDFFTYDPPEAGTVEWHMNFANRDLFAFYAGALLAQDELQVLEHPVLASLRRALLHDKLSTLVEQDQNPTPILIQGVPRQIKIATDPNATQGRPRGLYGNAFAYGSADAIRKAIAPIDPPTLSNILAIEAPPGGHGNYTAAQIRAILITGTSGFMAASAASCTPENLRPHVIIHTGFWGCGAYGGNRKLMTILQLAAARVAEVDLVYHTADKAGLGDFKDASGLLRTLLAQSTDTETLIARLVAQEFPWGQSDGN